MFTIKKESDIKKALKAIFFKFNSEEKDALKDLIGNAKVIQLKVDNPNEIDVKESYKNIYEYKYGSGAVPHTSINLVSLDYEGEIVLEGNPFFPDTTSQTCTKSLSTDGKCSVTGKVFSKLDILVKHYIFNIARIQDLTSRPLINQFYRNYLKGTDTVEQIEMLSDDYPNVATLLNVQKKTNPLQNFKMLKVRQAKETDIHSINYPMTIKTNRPTYRDGSPSIRPVNLSELVDNNEFVTVFERMKTEGYRGYQDLRAEYQYDNLTGLDLMRFKERLKVFINSKTTKTHYGSDDNATFL